MSAAGGRTGRVEFVQERLSVAWDDRGLEIRVTGGPDAPLKLAWSQVLDLARQAGAVPPAGGSDRTGQDDRRMVAARPGGPEGGVEEALLILDLAAGASEDDIREAHRELAKVWRPQRFGKNAPLRARAQRMLKRINEAYAILGRHRPSEAGSAPVPRPAPTGDDTLVGPRPLSEIRLPESALAVLVDEGGRSVFPIRSKSVLVGRYDPVTGALPEVDLTQADVNRSVSRRHARIVFDGGSFLLSEEEGARNGTFLNGRRIAAGTAVPLQSGDRIAFGSISLVFRAAERADRKSA